MAMGYILDSDWARFGKLIEDLINQHTKGMKSFPQTLSEAFSLTNNWKKNTSNLQRHSTSEGVAFMTKGQTNAVPKKKNNKDHLTCGETGHYSNECTAAREAVAEEGKQFLSSESFDDMDEEDEEEEFIFSTNPFKHSSNFVSKNWVLLDNQSTIDFFKIRICWQT